MELLDRYLQAVRKQLPKRRRDDIIEELRANLLAQAEDKQSELGRPLTLEEEEAMLKQHGHPLLVAARYYPHRHLIGPSLFPYYWFALKTTLALTAAVYSVVVSVLFAVGTVTPGEILPAILRVPGIALNVAVWVTLIFAALEFAGEPFVKNLKFFDCWTPRSLPALEPEEKGEGSHPLLDFVASLCFALYLVAAIRHPALVMGLGAAYFKNSPLQIAPRMLGYFWAVIALALVKAVILGAYLLRPSWRGGRLVSEFLGGGLALVLLVLLMNERTYVVVAANGAGHYRQMAESLNRIILMGVEFAILVTGLSLVWGMRRKLFGRGGSHASASGQDEAHNGAVHQ